MTPRDELADRAALAVDELERATARLNAASATLIERTAVGEWHLRQAWPMFLWATVRGYSYRRRRWEAWRRTHRFGVLA